MNELKKIRIARSLTQKEAAERIGVSLRSYLSYENDPNKQNTAKYRFLMQEIEKMNLIDENMGILKFKDIEKTCHDVLVRYPVQYCYLFGSYAKGKATEKSDVDLLVSSDVTGIQFYQLIEELREALHKRVDLLDSKQLLGNEPLLNEVLREGIKIYGQ